MAKYKVSFLIETSGEILACEDCSFLERVTPDDLHCLLRKYANDDYIYDVETIAHWCPLEENNNAEE
jgi:hypothetical protein